MIRMRLLGAGVAASLAMAGVAQAMTVTATFGSSAGAVNTVLGGSPTATDPYSAVAESKPGTVANTPAASIAGGFFDASEPTFQGGGAPPTPDLTGVVLFFGSTPATPALDVVLGFEEAMFTFSGLLPSEKYLVEVSLFDMDDFGLTVGLGGPPAPELVVVTGNGVDLGTVFAVVGSGPTQLVTTTLGLAGMADGSGDLTIGFNEVFLWDPTGAAPLPGTQAGIRVEQISLTLVPVPGAAWAGMAMLGGLGGLRVMRRRGA